MTFYRFKVIYRTKAEIAQKLGSNDNNKINLFSTPPENKPTKSEAEKALR